MIDTIGGEERGWAVAARSGQGPFGDAASRRPSCGRLVE